MKTKLLIGLVALVLIFSAVNMASAACVATGKVAYVYLVSTSNTTQYAYIYVHQVGSVLPVFFYYFLTYNPSVISAALAAESGNLGFQVIGNATSCGATGTARYGGVVQYLYTFKNIY